MTTDDRAVAAGPGPGNERPAPLNEDVRHRFRRQLTRDTAPEVALRRELHRRGLRYRLNLAPVPGLRRRADVVFPRRRLAVFVDGCFWHLCPQHGSAPRNNADWWRVKLAQTVQRDRDTDARLAEAGWTVLRFWEHEDPLQAADRVALALQTLQPEHGRSRETAH